MNQSQIPILAFDTETWYTDNYSIKDTSYWNFTHHPEFDCTLISVVRDDGFEWCGIPKECPWEELNGAVWLSHNVNFDQAVLDRLQELGLAPRDIRIHEWHDTADLAAFLQCPRNLKGAVKTLWGKDLEKSVRDQMKGVKYQDLPPETQAKWREYALEDSRWCLRLFLEYGPWWPSHERRVSQVNREAARTGCRIDQTKLEADIKTLEKTVADAREQVPWYDGHEDCVILSAKKLAAHCESLGIEPPQSIAQDSPLFDQWCQQNEAHVPLVEVLRTYRKANTLLKKLEAIRARMRPTDCVVPIELKYFGAIQTGRFSGTGGVNFQNLNRDCFMGIDVRGLLIPRDGHKFVVLDYSQIEPRCLAWLCGNDRLLAAVRNGFGIYEAAAKAMGTWDGLPGTMKQTHRELYQLTKAQVLGLGYGLGPERFAATVKAEMGIDLSLTEAERLVLEWRARNPEVTQFWRNLERGLARSNRDTHVIELPSGRKMHYFNIRRDSSGWTYIKERGSATRLKVYGGLLTENCCQAMARDILAHAIVRLTKEAGLTLITTVHDEVVLESRTPEADLETAQQIMRQAPEWAADLPLEVEGGVFSRYQK